MAKAKKRKNKAGARGCPQCGHRHEAPTRDMGGAGRGEDYGAADEGPGPGYGERGWDEGGLLGDLPAFLRGGDSSHFLLGAALGATAAWVLSDEELRGKLIRTGVRLYAGIAGNIEELREQMADIRAEVAAGAGTAGEKEKP